MAFGWFIAWVKERERDCIVPSNLQHSIGAVFHFMVGSPDKDASIV